MIPVDVAATLRALVDRVRRNVPLGGDPERFHLEKSEIARRMLDLADALAPDERPARSNEPAKARVPGRRQVIVSTMVVAGRTVAVQRRRAPFAIHIG